MIKEFGSHPYNPQENYKFTPHSGEVDIEDADPNSELDDEARQLLEGDIDVATAERARAEFEHTQEFIEQKEKMLWDQFDSQYASQEGFLDNQTWMVLNRSFNQMLELIPPNTRKYQEVSEMVGRMSSLARMKRDLSDSTVQCKNELGSLRQAFHSKNNSELTLGVYVNVLKTKLDNFAHFNIPQFSQGVNRILEDFSDQLGGVSRWAEEYRDMMPRTSDDIHVAVRRSRMVIEEIQQITRFNTRTWDLLSQKFSEFSNQINSSL